MKKKSAFVSFLCLTFCFGAFFSACQGGRDSVSDSVSSSDTASGTSSDGAEESFEVVYNTDYAPVYFEGGSVTNTVTTLGEGVHMVANYVTLNNGNVAIVYAVEVDLSKADIRAGSYRNQRANWYPTTATPYSMMTAFEEESGKTVLIYQHTIFSI